MTHTNKHIPFKIEGKNCQCSWCNPAGSRAKQRKINLIQDFKESKDDFIRSFKKL